MLFSTDDEAAFQLLIDLGVLNVLLLGHHDSKGAAVVDKGLVLNARETHDPLCELSIVLLAGNDLDGISGPGLDRELKSSFSAKWSKEARPCKRIQFSGELIVVRVNDFDPAGLRDGHTRNQNELVLSPLPTSGGVHKIEIPAFEVGWRVDTSQEEILCRMRNEIFLCIRNLDCKPSHVLGDGIVEISNCEYGFLQHVGNIRVFKCNCQHAEPGAELATSRTYSRMARIWPRCSNHLLLASIFEIWRDGGYQEARLGELRLWCDFDLELVPLCTNDFARRRKHNCNR